MSPKNTPTDFDRLPIVDVSDLRSADPEARRRAAEALGRAAKDVGFFYITGHGVGRDLRAGLLDAAKDFFSRPEEEKMRHYIGLSDNHRGYVPEGEEVLASGSKDKKEGFDLSLDLPEDDPVVQAGTPMTGPNVWPDLPGFREKVSAYYDEAMRLGFDLCRGFALALDLPEDSFTGFVNKPLSQLRLLHYPFNPAVPPDRPGIGAHTDYEVFTILLPTAPGLEVMNGAGDWIDAPPVEDAFVVNIGDMMEVWTNGTYVATSHRVRKVAEERYSFPLFFGCDYETRVEPLPPFVDPAKPSSYEPLSAGEHLWAQTIQSFTYLKEKLARGEIALPEGSRTLSSFGQEARHAKAS